MIRVLFVCFGNSGRSQMAEAFFDQAGDIAVKAMSAGTDPAKSVNPIIIKLMQEEGIDISKNSPKLITDKMLSDADIIITMGCGATCPCLARRRTVDCGLIDPEGKELRGVRKIRDQINKKVTALINEMNNYGQKEVTGG
mgnify:CR=1 FL=1